jgi:hypothetical protein
MRYNSGFPSRPNRLFDAWGFVDGSGILVKSMNALRCVEESDVERIIENSLNLRHLCISGVIRLVLPSRLFELPFIEMDSGNNALSKVISTSAEW